MPVTNLKFFNTNQTGASGSADSVIRATNTSIIYNSGSSSSPTLLGELLISNSNDSGYDISASLRLGERSTTNKLDATLISCSATNITESGTSFYFAKRGPSNEIQTTKYKIQGLDVELSSNNLRLVATNYGGGRVWLGNYFINPGTSGYLKWVLTKGDNTTVYWDSTKWDTINFNNISVPAVITAGQYNGNIIPGSSGGTYREDLYKSILIGNGNSVKTTVTASLGNSGSMVVSDGSEWKTLKTSSIQFTAETSSYLKPLDFDLTSISFITSANASADAITNIVSTNLNTVINFSSSKDINISQSFSQQKNINFNSGDYINLSSSQNVNFNNRINLQRNAQSSNSNIIVQINKSLNLINTGITAITASLPRGLYDNQIITLCAQNRNRGFHLKCEDTTAFASPELSSGYFVITATQLRYDANLIKWFRHF